MLGLEHFDTLTTMNNLAGFTVPEASWPRRRLHGQVLEIKKRVRGPAPHTLTSMNNLAHLYYAQGNRPEAATLFTNCPRFVSGCSAEHPHTLAFNARPSGRLPRPRQAGRGSDALTEVRAIRKKCSAPNIPTH